MTKQQAKSYLTNPNFVFFSFLLFISINHYIDPGFSSISKLHLHVKVCLRREEMFCEGIFGI